MRHNHGVSFVDAGENDQTALLDRFLAAEEDTGEPDSNTGLGPGVRFFDWIRKMVVDAYYTSEIGIKDLGYQGNGAYEEYTVPREAIDHALKRNPLV
jgi:hypothetical protein